MDRIYRKQGPYEGIQNHLNGRAHRMSTLVWHIQARIQGGAPGAPRPLFSEGRRFFCAFQVDCNHCNLNCNNVVWTHCWLRDHTVLPVHKTCGRYLSAVCCLTFTKFGRTMENALNASPMIRIVKFNAGSGIPMWRHFFQKGNGDISANDWQHRHLRCTKWRRLSVSDI